VVKAYEAKTIKKFGGLWYDSSSSGNQQYDGAAIPEDEMATVLTNMYVTPAGNLTKRHSAYGLNNTVAPTITKPAGQPLTAPADIRMLAIQRIQAAYNDRIYFTDQAKTNVWYTELSSCLNSTCHRVMTPTNQAIDNAEWMIGASIAATPYHMYICRNNGGLVGVNHQGYPQAFSSSPAGTFMALHKERIFMINTLGTDSIESRVYYSESNDFYNWPVNNFFPVGQSGGDVCISMCVFNDDLYIFKTQSIWVLSGDGPSTWSVRNVHPSLGCVGRGTVLVHGGMIYFLGQDGAYRTDGTSFEKISNPVDQLVDLTMSDMNYCLKRYAWFVDQYYIVLSTWNTDTVLCYDTDGGTWSKFQYAGGIRLSNALPYLEQGTGAFYMGDYRRPSIYKVYGYDVPEMGYPWEDNHTGDPVNCKYTCTWRSKRLTFDEPAKMKRNYAFVLDVGATTGTVNVKYTFDTNDTTAQGTWTQTLYTSTSQPPGGSVNRASLKAAGAGYVRAMETEVNITNSDSFDIFSVTWLNQIKDFTKGSR
jgi:hypothetical protein